MDKNGVLFQDGRKLIDDDALVVLTIMIAESGADEKEMESKITKKQLHIFVKLS